jgi:hypothetical protein
LPAAISGAVEGIVDQAVFERLVESVGAEVGNVFPKGGKARLLAKIRGFNQAARFGPWLVLVDLDREECAPPFRRRFLRSVAPNMAFRVAVHAVEAWLLADRRRIATWLDVPLGLVPARPEALPDPKLAVVNLARRSRSRDVRVEMVPRDGSGRNVGALYPSRVGEFVRDKERGWRPEVAACSSDSLDRCLRDLRRIVRIQSAPGTS